MAQQQLDKNTKAQIYTAQVANFIRQSEVEIALGYINQLLSMDPQGTEGHYCKGIFLNKLGRFAEALPCFVKAKALNPQIATTEYFKREYEKASQMLGPKEASSGDKRAHGDEDNTSSAPKQIKKELSCSGNEESDALPLAVAIDTDVSTLGEAYNPINTDDFLGGAKLVIST